MDTVSYVDEVHLKKQDPSKIVQQALAATKKLNANHYFLTISERLAKEQAEQVKKHPKGKLAGVLVSVKDAVCVKDVETTAGSSILRGYVPVFNATVIERVIAEGGIILGKTNQDAFGFGTLNINVGLGNAVPKNPIDKSRVTGGSSGGCAGVTKLASFPHVGMAESTGGSIVAPAAFCGVVGLCPTYGLVSRYGLLDYANSLDKIGSMGKTVREAALLLEVMAGYDELDSTTVDKALAYASLKPSKKFKVGILGGVEVESYVHQQIEDLKDMLKKEGVEMTAITLSTTMKYGLSAYYVLAMSEASTNLAKYCGLRYGEQQDMAGDYNHYFSKVRTKHFTEETKRRTLLGTYARMAGFRDQYYIKAAQIRKKILEEYEKVFSKVDILLSPTMPMIAPKMKDVEKLSPMEEYAMDQLTVGPNLAGLPHLSLPLGEEQGLPTGLLITAHHFQEKKVVEFSLWLEKQLAK